MKMNTKGIACAGMMLIATMWMSLLSADEQIPVTDLAGRELTFSAEPKRIILGESRYLFAMSILDRDDPLQRVVGMLADLKQIDHGSYQQYQKAFPHIDDIPIVGHTSADSFSVEKVLSLKADLAIFGVNGHGPDARQDHLVDQLQRAGVNVMFVDFRNDPINNTIKSIELLGKVLRRESQAEAFVSFYQQQLQRVSSRLAEANPQSSDVFIHSRVGLQDLCCETMARGMMATFVKEVGGKNISLDLIPGTAGVMNLEYLLTHQPEIYIATAIGTPNLLSGDPSSFPPYVVLGAGVDAVTAQQSFKRALGHSGITTLQAVKSNRAYAIWHHFYNSPLNIVAVQVFAKWLYPELFTDLEPRETMEQLFERFQSVPLDGIYWMRLNEPGSAS